MNDAAGQDDGPLSDPVRELIQAQRLCYVATAGPDGQPNLSPKGSLKVLDRCHLAFARDPPGTALTLVEGCQVG